LRAHDQTPGDNRAAPPKLDLEGKKLKSGTQGSSASAIPASAIVPSPGPMPRSDGEEGGTSASATAHVGSHGNQATDRNAMPRRSDSQALAAARALARGDHEPMIHMLR